MEVVPCWQYELRIDCDGIYRGRAVDDSAWLRNNPETVALDQQSTLQALSVALAEWNPAIKYRDQAQLELTQEEESSYERAIDISKIHLLECRPPDTIPNPLLTNSLVIRLRDCREEIALSPC